MCRDQRQRTVTQPIHHLMIGWRVWQALRPLQRNTAQVIPRGLDPQQHGWLNRRYDLVLIRRASQRQCSGAAMGMGTQGDDAAQGVADLRVTLTAQQTTQAPTTEYGTL